MADTVFNKLVQGISLAERKALLEKIGGKAEISEEPLAADEPEKESVDLENVYRGLGLLSRVVIFIKMLFTGRGRDDVLERELLADIARDIQKRSSGIMDFSQGVFLPAFCVEILMLKDNVEPFVVPLREASGENRPEFTAFLAGLYMDDLQDRLFREASPYYQIRKFLRKGEALPAASEDWNSGANLDMPPSADLSDGEVKRMMDRGMEEVFDAIPQDVKTLLYTDMKTLYHLAGLSQFSFDKLIAAFASGPADEPSPCPFGRVKDHIVRLAEIMWNMKSPPSPLLMRALFLFSGGDKTGAALESDAARRITTADRALQNIREINKRMPWLLVARYVTRNVNYHCAVSGGAEDWFALLRQFWKERLEAGYKDFSVKRKEIELRREIASVFDPLPVHEINQYSFSVDGEILRGAYPLSLSLVKSFLAVVFSGEMGQCLKSVLIDGVFYKVDNRKEFTDGYNAMQKASGILENFESRLSSRGDAASSDAAAAATPGEYTPASVKRRKALGIIKETDLDAEYLLQTMQGGLSALFKVVNGILYGEIGGKYDTLSNLPDIGGRANADFRRNLDAALRRINAANTLLQKLVSVERSWQESRDQKEKP